MRTLTTINEREIKGDAYRNLNLANQAVAHSIKPVRVMLGDADQDGGWFWVVMPADAARLERAGYEYANQRNEDDKDGHAEDRLDADGRG